MEQVLADAGDRWKIVFFHHPPYTSVIRPSGKIRQFLTPLFDRYNVSVTFAGHAHLYERSHPIFAGSVADAGQGTVYVVTGAGGGDLFYPITPLQDDFAARSSGIYSFTITDVGPEKLTIQQIALDGSVLDAFEVIRPQDGR
jgi:hypothetical protein